MLRYSHLITLALAVVLAGCTKDDVAVMPVGSTAQFKQTYYELQENGAGISIEIQLSKPATKPGYIRIAHSSDFSDRFVTDPAANNGVIIIPFPSGATEAAFKAIPVDKGLSDGSKTLEIILTQVSDELRIGASKALSIKLLDDESSVNVSFAGTSGSVKEDLSAGADVVLQLSEAAPARGTVEVSISGNNLVYGTHFITQPAVIDGRIYLLFQAGQKEVGFKVIAVNDTHLNESRSLQMTIAAVTGGMVTGPQKNYELKVLDDESAGYKRSYHTTAGTWQDHRYFQENADGTVSKITWEQYTPSYRGGSYTYEYINNRLHKMVENANRETYYLWEGDRIVKTEQYTNGLLTQYVLYAYDPAGHVGEAAIHVRTPDGSMKYEILKVYLYYTDGNLYRELQYSPIEGTTEYSLNETKTYSGYLSDRVNPFPLEILPNINAQPNLPTQLEIVANGRTVQFGLAYQFGSDGLPVQRTVTGGNSPEVTSYEYY